MYSLKDNGKAAIVVPTGFLTAQSNIEKIIREKMINEKMLKGIISMPSNIFATTGTNVSIIILDKSNPDGNVLLVDASNLGTKVKDGKNQKTVLSSEEIIKIEDTFINQIIEVDFSVLVSFDEIKEKNYSFSAGQYFDVKIEYKEITQEEFNNSIKEYKFKLEQLEKESNNLYSNIIKSLEDLKYE